MSSTPSDRPPELDRLYEADRVRALFDEMAATYGTVNTLSSFGFCHRWRRQCVDLAPIRPEMTVCDLMTGMGECWPLIADRLRGRGRIIGVDFSAEMCRRAHEKRRHMPGVETTLLEEDALASSLLAESVDSVVCSFGLKTFSDADKARFAGELVRLLKPGGTYSLLEISVPPGRWLRAPYMTYLRHGIPPIGRMFLGNPDNYRLLGVYTERFGNVEATAGLLRRAGLEAHVESLFFGCATAVHGRKAAAATGDQPSAAGSSLM